MTRNSKAVVVGAAGRRGGKGKHSADPEMPSDDEVDAFHKSKDKLALNVSDDDDDESESGDDDGLDDDDDLLGLSDDDDDESNDDESDDDDEDGDGRLAQREYSLMLFLRLRT